jgi:hypothetical protein
LAGVEEKAAAPRWVLGSAAAWPDGGKSRGRVVECRGTEGSIAREGRGIRRIEARCRD